MPSKVPHNGEIISLLSDFEEDDESLPIHHPHKIIDISDSENTNGFQSHKAAAKQPSSDEIHEKILDFFPEIDRSFVKSIYNKYATTDSNSTGHPLADIETITISIILQMDDDYPRDPMRRKIRKRKLEEMEDPQDFSEWTIDDRESPTKEYTKDVKYILLDTFSHTPANYISRVVDQYHFLFPAYAVIEREEHLHKKGKDKENRNRKRPPDNPESSDEELRKFKPQYQPVKRARTVHRSRTLNQDTSAEMFRELEAARKKVEQERVKRKQREEARDRERENRDIARAQGNLVTCDICYEDRPQNRMTSCSGKPKHTYCFRCVKQHIETIVGAGRWIPVCMEDGCNAAYPKAIVIQLLDKATIDRMDRLQLNTELAGVGLDECPFCNFRAICETPTKFDCRNPECNMSSCLKCKEECHIPKSCDEAKRDKGKGKALNLRHLVEEAMTEALLRTCPGCKARFYKEIGCNHMTCSACRHSSCYVCGARNVGKSHFGNPPAKCPMQEVIDDRHESEIKRAEREAKTKIKKLYPDISNKDLDIAMSDRVKDDDKKRRDRSIRDARGENWHPGMPIEGADEDLARDIMLNQGLMMGGAFGMPRPLLMFVGLGPPLMQHLAGFMPPFMLPPGMRMHNPFHPPQQQQHNRHLETQAPPPPRQNIPGATPGTLPWFGQTAQQVQAAQRHQHQQQHQHQHQQANPFAGPPRAVTAGAAQARAQQQAMAQQQQLTPGQQALAQQARLRQLQQQANARQTAQWQAELRDWDARHGRH